jgi:hypothetical protein
MLQCSAQDTHRYHNYDPFGLPAENWISVLSYTFTEVRPFNLKSLDKAEFEWLGIL